MRAGCPTGKVIHTSKTEAQFVLLCLWREAQGKPGKKAPKRAYECDRGCGGWHLTSMTDEQYQSRKRHNDHQRKKPRQDV